MEEPFDLLKYYGTNKSCAQGKLEVKGLKDYVLMSGQRIVIIW